MRVKFIKARQYFEDVFSKKSLDVDLPDFSLKSA